MNFDAFEAAARRVFDEIPTRYKAGVDGLTVRREALAHPRFRGIYTLGECATESYPSGWGGPDTTRSLVVLHWGSFDALAKLDPTFDWDGQIWETLTHELRHHLESLADRDDLLGVDYAMEQTFLRDDGRDFDPGYYRHGDQMAPGVYAVEDDVYIEQTWNARDFGQARAVAFSWAGRSFQVDRPATLGDIHFVQIGDGGPPPPPYLELVLVRKESWMERVRRAWRRDGAEVWESAATAVEQVLNPKEST